MSFTIDPSGTPIVLRSPDPGDTIRIDTNDIKRFTRGGDLKVFLDSDWAALVIHVYKFSRIRNLAPPDDLIDQMKAFLVAQAGQPLTILDHLGETLTGYIITPINEIVYQRPDCSHDIGFEFMETPV